MSDLLRVYLDPGEIGLDGYPYAWRLGDLTGPFPHEGSAIKDLIHERDGHRCLRCGHPYTKGEYGNGQWSPCDERCTHRGPARFREAGEGEAVQWSYVDLEALGAVAGDGLMDDGPDGRRIQHWEQEAEWRILTVHHLNGIKYDCRWWNLVSLCQRCHLTIQGKVYMDRPWPKPHSEWFEPFAAGFYAWKYLDQELDQEQTLARLPELLALERTQDPLW